MGVELFSPRIRSTGIFGPGVDLLVPPDSFRGVESYVKPAYDSKLFLRLYRLHAMKLPPRFCLRPYLHTMPTKLVKIFVYTTCDGCYNPLAAMIPREPIEP